MQNQPKISVIVPIYKAEKYLKECIDSILNQILKDIEIILVDDGSPDNCSKMCDEYAKKDNRIKVIHQQNFGYGMAINKGIENATGEYMGIVESDDFIEIDMYETLYNIALENNKIDIVKSSYYEISRNIGKRINTSLVKLKLKQNLFNIYDDSKLLIYRPCIWTAIYRLDFIKENNIVMFEKNKGIYADNNWKWETLLLAKSIYYLDKPLYNYRIDNPNSTINKRDNYNDIYDVYEEINSFIDNKIKTDIIKYKKILEYLYCSEFKDYMEFNINRVKIKYLLKCAYKNHIIFNKWDRNIIENSKLLTNQDKRMFKRLKSKFWFIIGLFVMKPIRRFIFTFNISKVGIHIQLLGIQFTTNNFKSSRSAFLKFNLSTKKN